MKIRAQCDCGKLRFETSSQPVLELCCHCLDCKDAFAADFADIAFFKCPDVSIEGEFAEKIYTAASGNKTRRQYCADCNSILFDRSEGFPNLLGVSAKQIEPPFEFTASCHIFLRDKSPELEIPAGTKRFEMGIE